MNIVKRTCATCAAFNPSATDDEEVCGNLTFFTEYRGTPQAVSHEPSPADWCPSHQTHEEDKAEDAGMVTFWQRLGLAPRLDRSAD